MVALPTPQRNIRGNEEQGAQSARYTSEDLGVLERAASRGGKDGTANRRSGESRQRSDRVTRSCTGPNLLDGRDVRDQNRREANAGTGGNAEEGREYDRGCVARGWNPKGEHQDAGESGHDDHHVEVANLVGHGIWDGAADDAKRSVNNGNEVVKRGDTISTYLAPFKMGTR